MIILNTSSSIYKSDFIESFSHFAQNETDYDKFSELAYQEYELGLKGVKDEYTFQCHEIDAYDEPLAVIEQVEKIFMVKGRGAVPRKPPKVCVVGPPLSGKTTLSQNLALKYGLTLIDAKQVIVEASLQNNEIGKTISAFLKTGQNIPDKVLIELMRDRFDSIDCKMNGWVLDGYPVTFEQCRSLKYLNQSPTTVFFLEANDNVVTERAKHRKIDPKTGKIHGKDDSDDPELVALPEDNEEHLKTRLVS